MKTCPTCGREYPDNVKFCQADGATLKAKAASSDLVGQVVADRYHILKKLGEGGMGAVYLGEHVKMGRKSAIKVMMAAMANDPDAVARFNREASNASRISHPNVCQIFDFGETSDGLIYLAMEYIEGHSLKDLVEDEGALPAPRAANIIRQAADALQAAHDLGIVHRDIKPDNIMVIQGRDGADIVKVVDFGIARAVGGDEPGQKVTKTGLVVGTPEYMSPEQLSGDKLDGRSDTYSLGLVLYRLVTGTLPFQADSAQETMIKRLTDDPMPLSEARTDIDFPPKLQLVMNTALARTAAERYQSAAEFGRDAMDAVAGMKAPETRVQPAHEGATHIMSKDELTQATKAQPTSKKKASARPAPTAPTTSPAAPKKSLPVGIIVGTGGGLVAIAAVAVLMTRPPRPGGTGADSTHQVQLAANQTGRDTGRVAANPPPGGTQKLQNNTRIQNQNTRPDTPTARANNPPPTGGGVAIWADTLKAADNAYDDAQMGTARQLATAIFNTHDQIPPFVRARAAAIVATVYVSTGQTDNAITWYENAKRYATGEQLDRYEAALANLRHP